MFQHPVVESALAEGNMLVVNSWIQQEPTERPQDTQFDSSLMSLDDFKNDTNNNTEEAARGLCCQL